VQKGRVFFEREKKEPPEGGNAAWQADLAGRVALPGGGVLRARQAALSRRLKNKIFSGDFAPEKEAFLRVKKGEKLAVRFPQAGDLYRPLGAPGRKLLSAVLRDRKVPRKERKRIPLVCNKKGEILCVWGIGISEEARIGPAHARAWRLTLAGAM